MSNRTERRTERTAEEHRRRGHYYSIDAFHRYFFIISTSGPLRSGRFIATANVASRKSTRSPVLDTDFTDSVQLLEEGLERIDSRGGTAFYDALHLAMDHLAEKASWDKKVLLLITDGEDNASRITLEQLVRTVQRSDVMVYTVGLLGGESSRSMRRAKRALENIAKASGGSTYFPKSLDDVQVVANDIADDIRNQYVLAYTPTNATLDGKFRKVEVKLRAPRKYGRLTIRSRGGYYAEAKPAPTEPTEPTEQPEQSSGL